MCDNMIQGLRCGSTILYPIAEFMYSEIILQIHHYCHVKNVKNRYLPVKFVVFAPKEQRQA